MKTSILSVIAVLFICSTLYAQKGDCKLYSAAFYNLENLFDYENYGGVRDKEFTPSGEYAWTQDKYYKKLDNIAYVISRLAKEKTPDGPAVIGVAEAENKKVLQDLVERSFIADVGYGIVHYDSPDRRGIDVALLYNPDLFEVTSSQPYPYNLPDNPDFKTRDQLLVSGILAGEPFHVIVNHWPSRYGAKSSELREFAASITKHIADSIYKADPQAKIVIMGDMNDDPNNNSTRLILEAKRTQEEVKPGGLFNTMWGLFENGIGSLAYKGKWNLFDQIIISESLLGNDYSTLKFIEADVFNRDFLIQQDGKYKGYPLRTFSGKTFINGYSDHFPTLIYMKKQDN